MLRAETRARARALQTLYAWELLGKPEIARVAAGVRRLCSGKRGANGTELSLAVGVVANVDALDTQIVEGARHWRLERIGAVERNILRLALHELTLGSTPPRVVIDEAVRLARWFAGAKAPAFINGVVDGLARQLGRL